MALIKTLQSFEQALNTMQAQILAGEHEEALETIEQAHEDLAETKSQLKQPQRRTGMADLNPKSPGRTHRTPNRHERTEVNIMDKLTYEHELGSCEACYIKIADQHKYQRSADDCIMCEEHAATYRDILQQWQHWKDDGQFWEELNFDTPQDFHTAIDELAKRDDLDSKPLRGPEVETNETKTRY